MNIQPTSTRIAALTATLALAGTLVGSAAEPVPDAAAAKRAAAARAVLDKHLAGERAAGRARVARVDTGALRKTFGDAVFFFSLRFPKFPVAIAPAGGTLAPDNLFVISGGKVTHLKSGKALEQFCRASLPKLDDPPAADDAVKSCLQLAEVFYGDGMFRFLAPTTVVGLNIEEARGALPVEEKRGDKGAVTVRLAIAGGKVTAVTFGANLSSGIRPRCQATRLLDPDPAVRAIMRRDILVMGSAGKAYLDAQRAKAGPELAKAIDAVWRQILAEGR